MAAVNETRTWTSILAATLARRQQEYVTQVGSQCPLWYWLTRKGKYISQDGGERFEVPVEYSLPTEHVSSYSGYDTWTLPAVENVTLVIANWKFYRAPIVISGEERTKNSGNRVFDLAEQKEKSAIAAFINVMSDHIYGDGTGNNGKNITGLAAIVADNPTSGTLFGINRANESWWRNRYKNTNAAAWSATGGTPTMRNDMMELFSDCELVKAGTQKSPDLIICNRTYWRYYGTVIEKIGVERYVNKEVWDAGFRNLAFEGATMIWDEDCPDYSVGAPPRAYFLNTNFLRLYHHPKRNMTVTPTQMLPEQDAFAANVLWAGALLCTNCAKQGVHYNITALAA